MQRLILGIILALGVAFNAYAQNPVVTRPYPTTSISNNSSSIATTNTFQTIFPASTQITGRVDCLVQNNSSRNMTISFEDTPTITSNAMTLTSGATFRCANSGVVIRNKISITGTAADPYFAIQE